MYTPRPAYSRRLHEAPLRIKFWGVRGSVPVPGPRTVRYGGNSVCVEVRLKDDTMVVFDAGTGSRDMARAMIAEGYNGKIHQFLTHVHLDHVLGIPFAASTWRSQTHAVVYPLVSNHSVMRRLRPLFSEPFFPVSADDLPMRIEVAPHADEWTIGSAKVRRIPLNHPGGAQGFRVDDDQGQTSLAYLTDNELGTGKPTREAFIEQLAEFCRGVDVLVHDAQYLDAEMGEKRGWGHSTVEDVLALAKAAKPKRVVFFHHDPDRDDDALDQIGAKSTAWLAEHVPAAHLTVAFEGLTIELPEKSPMLASLPPPKR